MVPQFFYVYNSADKKIYQYIAWRNLNGTSTLDAISIDGVKTWHRYWRQRNVDPLRMCWADFWNSNLSYGGTIFRLHVGPWYASTTAVPGATTVTPDSIPDLALMSAMFCRNVVQHIGSLMTLSQIADVIRTGKMQNFRFPLYMYIVSPDNFDLTLAQNITTMY